MYIRHSKFKAWTCEKKSLFEQEQGNNLFSSNKA